MKISAFAAGTLLLGAALGVAAQKVYRCGPDGSIYQQTPCAEGQAVDVSDPRTTEQRKQAQAGASGGEERCPGCREVRPRHDGRLVRKGRQTQGRTRPKRQGRK